MYQRNVNIRIGGPITPGVKFLMIVNGVIFLIQQITGLINPNMLEYFFGISHNGFVNNFMIWQPFTYMFLHGGWMHIFFNLLGLWMFAGDIEMVWGRKKFVRYYILSGIGAGFFIALMNYVAFIRYGSSTVTIGASGAIYAVLLAYAILWPEREVLLYFLFPVKIKYLVIAFGLLEFFGTLSSTSGRGGNISHIGHLGGIISGLMLMKFMRQSSDYSFSFFSTFIKKKKLDKKKKLIDSRVEAKKIIDELLAKIARSGINSLTPDEKKKLEWARKNYYPSSKDIMH